MTLTEARTVRLLSEVADGSVDLDDPVVRLLEQDLRFQAELVQYRKMLRALASLRDQRHAPPPDLFDGILSGLDREGGRPPVRGLWSTRRAAYLGGIAAAAGVGSAIVLARLRHRIAA